MEAGARLHALYIYTDGVGIGTLRMMGANPKRRKAIKRLAKGHLKVQWQRNDFGCKQVSA